MALMSLCHRRAARRRLCLRTSGIFILDGGVRALGWFLQKQHESRWRFPPVLFFLFRGRPAAACSHVNHTLHDRLLKEREFHRIWQHSDSEHLLLLLLVRIKTDSHLDAIRFLVPALSSWTGNEDKDEENQQSHKEGNESGKEEGRHRSEDWFKTKLHSKVSKYFVLRQTNDF